MLVRVAAKRDACSKSVPPPCFLIMYFNLSLLRSPVINQTPTGYVTLVSVSSDKGLLNDVSSLAISCWKIALKDLATFELSRISSLTQPRYFRVAHACGCRTVTPTCSLETCLKLCW